MEILREEYLDYMLGRRVVRPLLTELFGPLIGLPEEWRAQGAREDEISQAAFGFDWVRRHFIGVATELFPGWPEEILEDGPERRVTRNRFGRRSQLIKATATIPLPMDFPVCDGDSWRRYRPHYTFTEDRFLTPDWAPQAQAARQTGAVIGLHVPGAYDQCRELMGEEALSLAYYDQPELIHDMLDTIGIMVRQVLDRVTRQVTVDQIMIHEDFAGRNGPLVGPRQVQEFLGPYYRSIWDLASDRGAQLFVMDTDGNFEAILPALLEAGVNGFYPMEPAAGMDIVRLRQVHGTRLCMLGGLNKFALLHGHEAIRTELEYKLQPAMRAGGIIFSLDHRIVNGTPLEAYRYYVRTAREILGLDPNPAPCPRL